MVQIMKGGLKTGQNVCFMVQNVQYLKGPPNHMIRPFENQTKKCLKSQMFGFQVFSIQMVTVIQLGFEYFTSPVFG